MWWLLAIGLAGAQDLPEVPDVDAQLWRASLDATATVWTDDARLPDRPAPFFRGTFSYVNTPLSMQFEDGDRLKIISDAAQLDLAGGYAIGPARFGVDVPVYLVTAGDLDNAGGAGLGNIVIDVKGIFLRGDVGAGLGAALLLPTSTLDLPLGLVGPGVALQAIVDAELDDLLVAANVGYRIQPKVDVAGLQAGNQLFWRLGAGYALSGSVGASFDLVGQAGRGTGVPMEIMLGGSYALSDGLIGRLGVGRGFTKGIGSSALRVVLSVGWAKAGSKNDRDGDTIADDADRCPDEMEDFDGTEDQDGCPDPDDDGDGVLDFVDNCPNEAEDPDGVLDEDGCPEGATLVSLRFQTKDGFPVEDISVSVDNGAAQQAVAELAVVLEPGVHSLVTEAAGFDASRTTIMVEPNTPLQVTEVLYRVGSTGRFVLKVRDPAGQEISGVSFLVSGDERLLPVLTDFEYVLPGGMYHLVVRAAEFRRGKFLVMVEDGDTSKVLIDLQPAHVSVGDNRITTSKPITFQPGMNAMIGDSAEILDEVAEVLIDTPDIRKVRIEAHVATSGDPETDAALSEQRAMEVWKYLLSKSVPLDRMEYKGLGATAPVEGSDPADPLNNRTELRILAWTLP